MPESTNTYFCRECNEVYVNPCPGPFLCPKCGRLFPHHQGVPCLNERCEDCGVALIREGSAHHDEISKRRGDAVSNETEG